MSVPGQTAAPFPNNYLVKRVAESDARACVICFKPASTVLLSENKVDFFYVCAPHLKDSQFATSVKPDDYTELVKKKAELESKVALLKQQAEKVKPYKITTFVSDYLGSKKEEPKDDKDLNDKPKKESNDAKYNRLTREISESSSELSKTTQDIANYSFKNYQLDKGIYVSRIQNYNKVRYNRTRSQKIQQDVSLFPSAPTNKIG
ncbi:DUF1742-domain-containing protein [Suhomyces tanzawaensis NRRL Y-17324]|uniref:DUF1742-domain-containing protein n=1 Tax=Suhomyces tanzawaensis NRRL Y-17324 TaxID=984487 RepID=A0A1E4SLA4_9ASCO|nr:DUF1742-domain-containing protein [Suhomyces tanzawaensis NRRL Y-17324]ODV80268.1 DUF1742-domain-containing protein [Suhomyces tanzawaensis NRRL Y-17324]